MSQDEDSPLVKQQKRLEQLREAQTQLVKEKEAQRLQIEEEFQAARNAALARWEEASKVYDFRIASAAEDIVKCVGVIEFLSESSDG